jgi:hypothetical protein
MRHPCVALHIGDQQFRRDSIGFVAHIDNHQFSMFGTSAPLGHRRAFDRFGRRRRADCRDACQHPRSHILAQQRIPPDQVASLTSNEFVDPHRHAVRTAQLVLPRIHPRPLRGGDVPALTNMQAFAGVWNRRKEHFQVGVRLRVVALDNDRLRVIQHELSLVEGELSHILGGENEQRRGVRTSPQVSL